jgi:outer membrane protein assembly factor BamB
MFAALLSISFLCGIQTVNAREWTRFRGPNGQGVSSAATIGVKWSAGDYAWKIKLAGGGHSSPIVWGDRVFVTSADSKAKKGIAQAFSVADGRQLWKREYVLGTFTALNSLNSYATGTPCVDADGIYIFWQMANESLLVALNHEGQEIWKSTFAGVYTRHGPGKSAIVVGDLVVFGHEQRTNDKGLKGAWIAVDRKTGKTRWTIERTNTTKTSYSTPCLYPTDEPAANLVFTSYAHGMTAVEPLTGKIAWEAESAFPRRVVSSPVIAGDCILGTCGQGGGGYHLIAIKAPSKDDSAQPKVAYTVKGAQASYVSTALAKDGLLFTFHDKGDVSCLRAATGEVLWSERPGGRFFGSPVWVAGALYCINRQGQVVVLRASPEYELLAINDLGEMSHATPAVAGGRMFLRTFSHLACLEGKGK